jgi:hypothetical protein
MMTSEEEIVKLRVALAETVDEIGALKARLDGDIPQALRWLQRKAERQRYALDRLNRTVLSLHFALRLANRLREPVTAAEWRQAREAIADEALRERVDAAAPKVA